jgi:hypothetical protein
MRDLTAIGVPIDSPVVGARDREHRTYRFPRAPISFLQYPARYWRYPTTWKDIELQASILRSFGRRRDLRRPDGKEHAS